MCLALSRTCLLNRSAFCNQNCNISEVFVIQWKSLRMTTPSLRPGLFRKPFPSYFCYFPSYFFVISETLPFVFHLFQKPFPLYFFLSFRNLCGVFVYFRNLFLRISLFQKHFPSYFFVYLRKRSLCISFYLFQKPFTLYFFASEPLPMDHSSLKGTVLRRINFSCALSS